MARHIPAEADIQADHTVRPELVEEIHIHRTVAEEADRILVVAEEADRIPVVGEVGHILAVMGAGRIPAVHRSRLVVVDIRPGVDRMEVLGHNHRRRTGLLLERVELVIFRLWCRRMSRWLQA